MVGKYRKKKLEHLQFNLDAVNKPIILNGYKGIDYIYAAKINKEVGDSGEVFILRQEQAIVNNYHLPKSKEVRRVSLLGGDGLGYQHFKKGYADIRKV